MKKGYFMDGSVSGIDYRSANYSGKLDDDGSFSYEEGDVLSFSIGDIFLGSCTAKELINTTDFVPESCGSRPDATNCTAANMARLLLSVGKFTPEITDSFAKLRYTMQFCHETETFASMIAPFLKEIGVKMITIESARNILRRCTKGMLKETDVKVPVAEGRYVLADIYRPLVPGKYPVVISMGAFGKSFIIGYCRDENDKNYLDMVEDRFYDAYGQQDTKMLLIEAFFRKIGKNKHWPIPNALVEDIPQSTEPPMSLVPVSPVFEQARADDWVPYGYVVMNVEEYGTGTNNDHERQFGAQNAKDYCRVIEWAAIQSWSSGKVGLYGASYYAMTQYTAAQRHPKGLEAMIAIMGDYDSYRHYMYSGGGLLNIADNGDLSEPSQDYCFMHKAIEEPFWNEESYGPEAEYISSADIKKIDYPIWITAEPDASLHGMGSSEAYINCTSVDKKFSFVNGAAIHFWMYGKEYVKKHRAFFDYWLKGIDNGIMDEPAVDVQIRTGNGGFYTRKDANWPISGTEYRKIYLDCGQKILADHVPAEEKSVTYNADVKRSQLHRVEGATFVSEPFEKDTALAGYIKAGLYVSSTTSDMEVHVQVRVLDENDNEVIYPAYSSNERGLPLGFGSLKVSHRALDPANCRIEHPYYLHTREAYAPLTPDEVVYCEVGMYPTSGLIRKGWKIQLDIDPVSNRWVDYNENVYRAGSHNSIYSGKIHPSFLQIPVLPE